MDTPGSSVKLVKTLRRTESAISLSLIECHCWCLRCCFILIYYLPECICAFGCWNIPLVYLFLRFWCSPANCPLTHTSRIAPTDCYVGNGETYMGVVTMTEDGQECLDWHSYFIFANGQDPFTMYSEFKGLEKNNHCRYNQITLSISAMFYSILIN